MKVDDQVNEWLKRKFLESGQYSAQMHGTPDEISVVTADADWECGCYSSYTRDDNFVIQAEMNGKGGNFFFAYGYWGDFPQFIEELDEYQKNYCPYDDEDDPWT